MDLDSSDKALLRSMSRATIGARNRQHTGARASPQTEKQSAATQRSVTADRELLQSYCLLLFDHGTAGYVAALCSSFVMRAMTPSAKGRVKLTAFSPNGNSPEASNAALAALTSRSTSAQNSQKEAIFGIAAGFVARISSTS